MKTKQKENPQGMVRPKDPISFNPFNPNPNMEDIGAAASELYHLP